MDASESLDSIIGRAKRNDPEAFDLLVDRFSGRLFGLLYRMTRSRDQAEDLLQEVFLRVVRTIGSYEHQGRFEAWLMRIAVNLVRDHVRKQSRRGTTVTASSVGHEEADPLDVQPGPSPRSDARAIQAEQVDELNAALARLPDGQREVIMLRHFSDLSFKDIAEALEIPLGTALARAHRGLERLRTIMEATSSP